MMLPDHCSYDIKKYRGTDKVQKKKKSDRLIGKWGKQSEKNQSENKLKGTEMHLWKYLNNFWLSELYQFLNLKIHRDQ